MLIDLNYICIIYASISEIFQKMKNDKENMFYSYFLLLNKQPSFGKDISGGVIGQRRMRRIAT